MLIEIKRFLKFLFGFCLAVLLSGFVYNYFPDFIKVAKETSLFTASLVGSQNQVNQDKIIEISDTSIVLQKILEQDEQKTNTEKENKISEQEKLDDLAEQIDVLQRKVNDLIEARKPKIEIAENIEGKKEEEKNDKEDKKDLEDEENKEDQETDEKITEFGKEKTNYLQILISEVEVAGETDDKQEFVELYNPNDVNIDLSNWYLQRKTKTADSFSTYVASNLFLNKIIYAKSYFLIARQGSFFAGFADILTENPLTEDNSLVLKNPNKENSDLLGFGNAQEFLGNVAENPKNGKTIGRKWIKDSEQNIGANYLDFEIQVPTPKAQNIKYVEPIIAIGGGGGGGIITPQLKNILINEVQIEGQTTKDEFIELYNPNNQDVNLSEFALKKKTASGAESSLVSSGSFSGTIPALGYFLIAPQDNDDGSVNYTGAIAPDLRYSGKTYSIAKDNTILLYSKDGNLQDKVGFGTASDFENIATINSDLQKTIGRKWFSETTTSQDTDNNFNDFEIQIPTPKTQNVTFVEPPIVETPKDITPPEVIFGLLPAIQTSLNFSINFQISDLLGTVTPSGVNSFVFRWKEAEGEWQEDAEESFSANPVLKDFIGQDGKTYYFQVKAKDVEGNWSEFLPAEPIFTKIELPPPPPPIELLPIIINEIQIEGEKTTHDFIEIYNPNNVDILINEYRLVKRAKASSSDTTIKSWGSEDKILAKQYYLWASSTDETYPALIGADIFTKQNISDNNGIAIRKGAEDAGEIIDSVGWGEFDNVLFEALAFTTNPEKNKSISRTQGADTNDNSKDFIILDTPTPKAE